MTLQPTEHTWPIDIFDVLKATGVGVAAYVPDAGHARLIRCIADHPDMKAVPLTTEEEGVAVLLGAWLGGQRGVLLMQSSGMGNCLNMLSLVKTCRFPFLTLIAMRGEWGEFNGWQVPMAAATEPALRLMDVHIMRASQAHEVRPVVEAAAGMVFLGGSPVAVLLSQQLIGAKAFLG